jgi:hypothetical protein
MSAALKFDEYPEGTNSGDAPRTGGPMPSDNDGVMTDILKRLGVLEVQVGVVMTAVQHLATKADLSQLETKMIKWIIATVMSAAGLAFAIAKLVH